MDPEGTEAVTGGLDDIDIDIAAEVLGNEDVVTEPVVGNEPVAPEDPYAAYGGKDTLEAAHKMYQAAQTEDGVVRLWLEAGKSLGLGIREMEQLVTGNVERFEAEQPEPEDLDRVLTYREFQEMQQQQMQAAAASQQEQVAAAAKATLQDTFKQLGVDASDPSANLILQLADKYLQGPNDLSPESVRNAVTRGHADFQALVENEAKAYLRKKVATKGALPKSPSGSAAPAAPAGDEPKSIEEAFARVRKQLGR
jgi:alanyl-tRNA synthetase